MYLFISASFAVKCQLLYAQNSVELSAVFYIQDITFTRVADTVERVAAATSAGKRALCVLTGVSRLTVM